MQGRMRFIRPFRAMLIGSLSSAQQQATVQGRWLGAYGKPTAIEVAMLQRVHFARVA